MVEEKRPGLSPGGVSRREFIGDAGLAAAAWVAGRGLITGGNYLARKEGMLRSPLLSGPTNKPRKYGSP